MCMISKDNRVCESVKREYMHRCVSEGVCVCERERQVPK